MTPPTWLEAVGRGAVGWGRPNRVPRDSAALASETTGGPHEVRTAGRCSPPFPHSPARHGGAAGEGLPARDPQYRSTYTAQRSPIKITVDIYDHLVPGANKAAVDRLDDATGRNLYATAGVQGQDAGGSRRRPVTTEKAVLYHRPG
jgi:hypothetical protein